MTTNILEKPAAPSLSTTLKIEAAGLNNHENLKSHMLILLGKCSLFTREEDFKCHSL
jgi:hypothetical protein